MSNWVLRVVRRSVMASLWLMKMLEAIFSGEGENGRGVFDFGFSAISLGFKNLNLIIQQIKATKPQRVSI